MFRCIIKVHLFTVIYILRSQNVNFLKKWAVYLLQYGLFPHFRHDFSCLRIKLGFKHGFPQLATPFSFQIWNPGSCLSHKQKLFMMYRSHFPFEWTVMWENETNSQVHFFQQLSTEAIYFTSWYRIYPYLSETQIYIFFEDFIYSRKPGWLGRRHLTWILLRSCFRGVRGPSSGSSLRVPSARSPSPSLSLPYLREKVCERRQQAGVGRREWGRISSRLCLRCETPLLVWFPNPWDPDLSQTKRRTLNWLSHSGTPETKYFKTISKSFMWDIL